MYLLYSVNVYIFNVVIEIKFYSIQNRTRFTLVNVIEQSGQPGICAYSHGDA